MSYTRDQAHTVLVRLGWHPRIPYGTAVESFQAMCGLKVDGIVGPVTTVTLSAANARYDAGKPTIPGSVYHSFSDFACHCAQVSAVPGAGCKGVHALPALVVALDTYAKFSGGKPLYASTYRCPIWNTHVGGASNSQHQYGAAADVPLKWTIDQAESLRRFSGIGWQLYAGQRLVRHVDVRHASGRNLTGGRTDAPTVWHY